jgi:hypothetical protein
LPLGTHSTCSNYPDRLPAKDVGMIVDRGTDFPPSVQDTLVSYGSDMWIFRDQHDRVTTRGLNTYQGEHRAFVFPTSLESLFQDYVFTVLNTSLHVFSLHLPT